MAQRLELQALLLTFTPNVYFQPPDGSQMAYPCIVYQLDNMMTRFANDAPYLLRKRYQITVMDRNPDSAIPDQVAQLPMCLFDRFFTANNLNHFVYNIYW